MPLPFGFIGASYTRRVYPPLLSPTALSSPTASRLRRASSPRSPRSLREPRVRHLQHSHFSSWRSDNRLRQNVHCSIPPFPSLLSIFYDALVPVPLSIRPQPCLPLDN